MADRDRTTHTTTTDTNTPRTDTTTPRADYRDPRTTTTTTTPSRSSRSGTSWIGIIVAVLVVAVIAAWWAGAFSTGEESVMMVEPAVEQQAGEPAVGEGEGAIVPADDLENAEPVAPSEPVDVQPVQQ